MLNKHHSMPAQVTKFTEPDNIKINPFRKMFNEEETGKILYVKEKLKWELDEFNLTIGKLGKQYLGSYFVSGGCIASLLQGEIPKDYDIYFFSKEWADRVVNLYTNDPAYMNDVAVYEEKYRDVLVNKNVGDMVITENAVTLKNGIQLITKHYGTPGEIRETFDFVHCMPYYNSLQNKFYISREQYDCCVNKILKINNTANLTSWREEKFKSRGYKYGN